MINTFPSENTKNFGNNIFRENETTKNVPLLFLDVKPA